MFFKKKENINYERILPKHIAIIMDGNGRWAKKRKLPRKAGHAAGSATFKNIAKYCNKIGIKYLTVYAFSTENWKRPKDEVENIMNILRDYLKDTDQFKNENIRLEFIGDREPLADDIKDLMEKAEADSENATGLHVDIALNYGGRDEIIHAVKRVCSDAQNDKIDINNLSEEQFSDYLYTFDRPDPDLIIRPSGEYRLSNYLIWQSAYSEFWFADILWPDFKPADLERAIDAYSERNRRFGGI